MELPWTKLWDDSDDDEDYDPLKDPLSKERDDSDDDFDGLMELLSPSKKSASTERDTVDGNQEQQPSGESPQSNVTPEVIGKRTRRRVHLPDEVWQDAESQLEQAERMLDPTSPNDICTDPNTQALSSQEYQRLLAVARGHAPEDADEDEDDEDFVPESDVEGDASKGDEDGAVQVSISRGELSDLMAENRGSEQLSQHGDGQDDQQQQAATAAKKRRGGRKRKPEDETPVRVVGDAYTVGPGAGGFSRDQCIQLQGQLREYFQLAAQQYALSCCDKEGIAERAEDIRALYDGLADLYRIWEVTAEYSRIQERAMQILTDQVVGAPYGGSQAVHVRPEPRFSFFNLPGIAHVPVVLQRVSDACSEPSEPPAAAASAQPADPHSGQQNIGGVEAAAGGTAASSDAAGQQPQGQSAEREGGRARALEKAQEVLSVLDPYFNAELKLTAAAAEDAGGPLAGDPGGSFTHAEDDLLLTGLRRFGTDWQKIHLHVLPTKSTAQLCTRYRRLVRRDVGVNKFKEWKFANAAGLTETETELLQKGVQYYGARFDLISQKVILNRSEAELRRAYAKLVSNARGGTAIAGSSGSVSSVRPEAVRKVGRPKGSTKAARKSLLNSAFLEGGSSDSDGAGGAAKRRRRAGRGGGKAAESGGGGGGAAEAEEHAMSEQALAAAGGFEQEHLSDSDEDPPPPPPPPPPSGSAAPREAAAGAGGAGEVGPGAPPAATPQAQLLPRICAGSPMRPRSGAVSQGSPGLVMAGPSLLSDSDSLPAFENSTDGLEARPFFRLLEEAASEGSNDSWLVSQPNTTATGSSVAAGAGPGGAVPAQVGAGGWGMSEGGGAEEAGHGQGMVTPAVRRWEAAAGSVVDSSAGKSAAPTPSLEAGARAEGEAGEGGQWSEGQDRAILEVGQEAAQSSAPEAYEEAWKKLSKDGTAGLHSRCVKALARRYEELVSKAINFREGRLLGSPGLKS